MTFQGKRSVGSELNLMGDSMPCPAGELTVSSEPAGEAATHSLWGAAVGIRWGDLLLHSTLVMPGSSFTVGEASGVNDGERHFALPGEILGQEQLELVTSHAGAFIVHVPNAASARVIEPAVRAGETAPVSGSASNRLRLKLGTQVEVTLAGDLVIEVIGVALSARPARQWLEPESSRVAGFWGVSAATVASLLAAAAYFVPPMGVTAGELSHEARKELILQYLAASAERETPPERSRGESGGAAGAEPGERASGAEGAMGEASAKAGTRRFQVKAPSSQAEPALARSQQLEEASTFGLVGLLLGSPDTPQAPWGRDVAVGQDDASQLGGIWGDALGDVPGGGGLGLSSNGDGGGGIGRGIGLSNVGTLGHGLGSSGSDGFGSQHGRLQGAHRPKGIRVRSAGIQLGGRLPSAVVQRIVRQNYGRFRLCYEKGLVRNPNLEGRVNVRFVIGADGSVASVMNGGSSLPDSSVVNCVIRAYYGLTFPKPSGGIVTVVYPLILTPG